MTLSLCGWDPEPDAARFEEHAVTFSDFCNNPMLLENSNLVVNFRGKYYNWKVAAPIISSLMVFNRPLLQASVDQLCNMHMPSNQSIKDVTKTEAKTSWWHWRRSKTSRETTPAVEARKTEETKETSIEIGDDELVVVTQSHEEKEVTIELSPKALNEKCKKTLRLSSKQIVSVANLALTE